MKTQIRSNKLLAITLGLVGLAALFAARTETHAQAEQGLPEPLLASGLVHVTNGQSAQLNLSWGPVPDDGIPPPDDGLATSVKLMIFDADGLIVAQSTTRLARRRSVSLTLNRDLLARTEARLGLRAVAKIVNPPDDGQPIPDDGIVASFEVLNNATQRTVLVSPVVLSL